jgi:hypothetical protein
VQAKEHPVNILFIHQNFPGQYRHIAAALADDPGNQVLAIGEAGNLGRLGHPRVRELGYRAPEEKEARQVSPPGFAVCFDLTDQKW